MFKKVLTLLMSLTLILTLIACGGGVATNGSKTSEKSSKSKLKQEYIFYEREGKTYFSDLKNEYLLCEDKINLDRLDANTGTSDYSNQLYLNETNNCLIYQKDNGNDWFIKDLSKIESDDINLGITNVKMITDNHIVYLSYSSDGYGISVYNIKTKTKEKIIDGTANSIKFKKINSQEFVYYLESGSGGNYSVKFGKYNLITKTLQESDSMSYSWGKGSIVLQFLDYPFSAITVINGGNSEEKLNGGIQKLYRFSFDKGFEFIDEILRECQYEFNENFVVNGKRGNWDYIIKTSIIGRHPNYYEKIVGYINKEPIFESYYTDGFNNTFLGQLHLDTNTVFLNKPVYNLYNVSSNQFGFVIKDKIYMNQRIDTYFNDGNKILIFDGTNDEYFIMDVDTEEKKYIDNNVEPLCFDGANLLYISRNKRELKLNDKIIGNDYNNSKNWVRYTLDLTNIAFCSNDTLSVYKDDETKMVAGNVKAFDFTNKNNICYLTNNDELFYCDYSNGPQKLCDCKDLIDFEIIR